VYKENWERTDEHASAALAGVHHFAAAMDELKGQKEKKWLKKCKFI
jgi:hypothetical protein